jgi:urease accessory protein
VRTAVEIVARAGPGGRTVLPVLRAAGALAVRATGPGRVHLVGTAAGPLGGDRVSVAITVEAGARLVVRAVAASVVLPGPAGTPSTTALRLDVAGALDVALEPTVVTGRATHESTVDAQLTDGAELRLSERVVLGRAGEGPGRWTGTTRVARAGVPVLHTSQELGPGGAGWAPPFTPRAYAGMLVLDGRPVEPGYGERWVQLPLPGGWTGTAWADRLDEVDGLAAVDPGEGGVA